MRCDLSQLVKKLKIEIKKRERELLCPLLHYKYTQVLKCVSLADFSLARLLSLEIIRIFFKNSKKSSLNETGIPFLSSGFPEIFFIDMIKKFYCLDNTFLYIKMQAQKPLIFIKVFV